MNLWFPPHVHHVMIGEELILLDEKIDRYYLLDEVDSANLIAGLEAGEENATIDGCRAAGLVRLVPSKGKIKKYNDKLIGVGNHIWANIAQYRANEFTRVDFLNAMVVAIGIRFFLKVLGLNKTLQLARKSKTKRRKMPMAESLAKIQQIANALYRISLLAPIKIQCLESSLSLFFFASVCRVNCDLKIGVQRYDFLAHAWIEIDGNVVADDPSLREKMPIMLELKNYED